MGVRVPDRRPKEPIQFRVDRPLGKLVKWLRLLGYDAISDSLPDKMVLTRASRSDNRIWITNAKQMETIEGLIHISTNKPIDQLRQIIIALNIQRQALKPFTRCSLCNCKLIAVDRAGVRGQVPDYIWETHRQFRSCDFCNKIFWPGSHVDRQRRIIDRLFE
jgi:uncharacterized protein with PIN domain